MRGGCQWVSERLEQAAQGPVRKKPLLPLQLLERRWKHVPWLIVEDHRYNWLNLSQVPGSVIQVTAWASGIEKAPQEIVRDSQSWTEPAQTGRNEARQQWAAPRIVSLKGAGSKLAGFLSFLFPFPCPFLCSLPSPSQPPSPSSQQLCHVFSA